MKVRADGSCFLPASMVKRHDANKGIAMRNRRVIQWVFGAVLDVSVCGVLILAAAACGPSHACTIGVAAGRATSDGRPLVWKVRDQGAYPDNHVVWNDNPVNRYRFIAVANAGDTLAWMGVNEAGFAIVNANSLDLTGRSDLTNGSLMHEALGRCATVEDFSLFLESTSASGMRDVHASYGVIDAAGAAVMFEVEDSLHWEYDADDPLQNPAGFIVRTNFSMAGGGTNGMARYLRSVALISEFCVGDSLDYRSLLRYHARDFSDDASQPIPIPYPGQWNPDVPYGYIWTYLSICRAGTVSGVVIRGIEPCHEPWQTTLWAMLGQPASTMAVPVWPVGPPPRALSGSPSAPLCDAANLIRDLLFDCPYDDYLDSYKLREETGQGLWPITFAVEDSLFAVADQLDAAWSRRGAAVPDPSDVSARLSAQALAGLRAGYEALVTAQPVEKLCVTRSDSGLVITWAPVSRSVAGTPLQVDRYEVICARAPWPGHSPELPIVTTQSWCVPPRQFLDGFFCRVTAHSSSVSSSGRWFWVAPLAH
ncbi:hypothetical protein JXA88_04660 [Candidatus Fermentibacteria bacterium]|nr:hypothetical protein [Candidatus Fermentibacteria bacterium]